MKIFPISLTFLFILIYKIDCLTNSSKCSNILPSSACSSDYQCPSNALCISSQCSCKFGYKLNLQTGCCEKLKCFYDFDCGLNARCLDFWNYNGHCECETDYSVNRDTQQCALDNKQDTKKLNPFVVILIIVFSLVILLVIAVYKMKMLNDECAESEQVSCAHARNNLRNISETIRENPASYGSINLNNNNTRFPANEREWNIERIRNSQPAHARSSNLRNSDTSGNNNRNPINQNSSSSTAQAHNNLRNSMFPTSRDRTSINVGNSSFDINEREWTPRNNSIIISNNRNSTTQSAHAHSNNLRNSRNSTTHTQRPAYALPVFVVELNHEKEAEDDLPPTYESLFD